MTKSLTILIVDDETAVRRALQRWLSRTGNVVLEAGSGEEALDVLDGAKNVDAVFLDLRLPTMSGRTLYHSIAARRPELATRTIIMSGDVDEPADREWLELHRLPVLPKPFELAAVDAMLRTLPSDAQRRLG
ncbi:MAG TPA: response regulator [Gemmatimonadales bacterium]|nr:response regulator [Gemmatimonadales bacterium]